MRKEVWRPGLNVRCETRILVGLVPPDYIIQSLYARSPLEFASASRAYLLLPPGLAAASRPCCCLQTSLPPPESSISTEPAAASRPCSASRACCRRYSTCSEPDLTTASYYHPTDLPARHRAKPRRGLRAGHRVNPDRTRFDGKNPEPSLTAPALTARNTSSTSDKLTFPTSLPSDEPTFWQAYLLTSLPPPHTPPPQAQSSGKKGEAQAERWWAGAGWRAA